AARLHSDTGAPRRIVLEVTAVDPDAWPVRGDAQLSAVAAAWVWMPHLTQSVWITTDDPELLVHLAIRQGVAARDAAGVTANAAARRDEPPLADPLAEVAAQSKLLVTSPGNAAAHLARARALIELDEIAAARRDLADAATTAVGGERAQVAARLAEIETRADRAYLPAQPPGGKVVDGAALTPLIPAGADLTPAIELVRKLRTRTGSLPSEAAPTEPVALHWLRARIAESDGRHQEAGARWGKIASWQAEVASLVALTASPFAEPDRDVGTAYALADKLATVELPKLARARMIALRRSRWSAIANTVSNAGSLRLTLPASPLAATPRTAVRRALLAVPWSDGRLLDPGREASFTLRGPVKVAVEAWCRRLGSNPADGSCQVSVRSDQTAPTTATVPFGQVTRLEELSIEPGRHQLTVALGTEDPNAVLALRMVELDRPAAVARGAQVFLASSSRPAESVVAGPMTVGLEIRGFGRDEVEARSSHQATVRVHGGTASSITLALDPDLVHLDPEEGRAPGIVTESIMHVVLVPAGVHRIAIRPDRGQLALRFAHRIPAGVDREDGPSSQPLTEQDGTRLSWPPASGVPLLIVAERARDLVSSVELVVGQDSIDVIDEGSRGLKAELAAQLRLRSGRTAVLGELIGRQVGTLRPTARVRAVGDTFDLPGGLRAHLELGGGVQRTPLETAWRLDGRVSAQRLVRLGPRTTLVPQLGIAAAALGPARPSRETDPWIAGAYRRDHPIQSIARAALRVRPYVDQLVLASIETRSNANLIGIDLVAATLSWQGLIEVSPGSLRGPIARLAYQPSYRFADADRASSYWRHDLFAEISWGRRVRRGRFAWSLWADVYPPSAVAGWERSLGVSMRWDDARDGQAVRHGFESAFGDFQDQVSWQDAR
ncbi:MAG: hypothetical protein H0X17_10650, partial [Deltaproteobacteria bacterium]|nr:hypothetical protein [Deltaproteobacteria bacterium]